jgi:hypothetical protein
MNNKGIWIDRKWVELNKHESDRFFFTKTNSNKLSYLVDWKMNNKNKFTYELLNIIS